MIRGTGYMGPPEDAFARVTEGDSLCCLIVRPGMNL